MSIVKIYAFALVLSVGLFGSRANAGAETIAGCDPTTNPHSFGCQEAAYEGRAGFQMLQIDWNQMQGEWFATTFAHSNANSQITFKQDVNPRNPRQPGRGVLNLRSDGWTSVVGSVFIQGDELIWQNWHDRQLRTGRGNLRMLDEGTVQIDANDDGQPIRFECRMFLRNENQHLTCKYSYLPNGQQQWVLLGYFGFLTRTAWDNFVRSSRQH